jgi:catechol 2,3-dioxygenase-like lactoylglutathione lyase family enzyme|tara:strand:- start:12091 stop:12495 length:405 start_codon:yes stop_codon:yes gene_type:complete
MLFAQQEEFKLTFNHQALPVKKLQETGDFYIHILGFEEMEVTASQANPKRWIRNHEGKQLHLISSEDGTPNTIVNHMAFSTHNLEAVIAHLRNNKIDYWTDEGQKNVIRIRKDGVRQVKIQDPEGHWIEINEAN